MVAWGVVGRQVGSLRALLRTCPLAELCARCDPLDAAWEGELYAVQEPPPLDLAAVDREAARHGFEREWYRGLASRRGLLAAGLLRQVSGEPLCSEAEAPFELDGRRYRSVACFYQALKLAEDDPRRGALAEGRWTGSRRGPRPARRGVFTYAGQELAVDSPGHRALVGRATEAKALAHAHVRGALAATGSSRLFMGDAGSGALGRTMPFALMVLRLRLSGR